MLFIELQRFWTISEKLSKHAAVMTPRSFVSLTRRLIFREWGFEEFKSNRKKKSMTESCPKMVISSLISRRTMSTIKSAKSALRKEIQAAIEKIDDVEKKRQSSQVFQKVLALPQYKESKRISVYLSTKDEIDTVPILEDIFKNKKEAFVPRYEGKKMCMVKLDSMEDYEKLPLTKWNIKQPLASDVRDDALETGGLDLVILPGVAFTATGKRLGHGMGYYDKFLQSCIEKQPKKPYLIAVAFNEQIRDDVPTTETDVLLDFIVTEKSFA